MLESTRGKLGALMILVGITLLLTMLYLSGSLFLVTLGLAFCGVYWILGGRKSYGNLGFLIPGLVLLSIGLYALLDEVTGAEGVEAGVFFLLLAAAFLGVFAIHTRRFRNHGPRYWPLFPAAGLTLFGTAIMSHQHFGWVSLELLNYLWVAVLIGAGLWLILGKGGR